MRMKRVLALCATALMTLSIITGCTDTKNTSSKAETSSSQSASELAQSDILETNKIYKIGLVQYVEHPSLDTIREAFLSRLEEWGYNEGKVLIDYQNASGDQANLNTICQKFVGDEVDMIFAIATPAAQVATTSAQGTDIKVVFAAVNNPEEDLKIQNVLAPEGNVTGTSDKIPVKSTIDLALQVDPNLSTFGFLYNSGESNSVNAVKEAKAYCEEKGISFEEGTVSNTSEVQQVVTDLCTKVDAIFTSTDNSIASSMAVVAEATKSAKVPFYAGADSMVADGALAAIGIDYTELGAKNADMVVELIEGKEIAQVPVFFFEQYSTYINQETYDAIGIGFPEEVLERAVYMDKQV